MGKSISRIHHFISALMSAVLAAGLLAVTPADVRADNSRFITEICLAEGAGAYDWLEEAGYRVMMAGLNTGVKEDGQVYLGYKINEGDPVTNIILSGDGGDTIIGPDGFTYFRSGDADVDAGTGVSNGYLYYTTDTKAGAPLVGLDLVRAGTEKGETLYAIPNDGAEYVKRTDGSPADLELGSDSTTMYLAQIRDGLVKPYISEIALVTEADKYSAVYTAACHGYNYYIDGDIDSDDRTYTLIVCMRTADPKEAITDVIAVSAETVAYLEEKQITSLTDSGIASLTDESGQADGKPQGNLADEESAAPGENESHAAAADPEEPEDMFSEAEAEAISSEEQPTEAEAITSEGQPPEAETEEVIEAPIVGAAAEDAPVIGQELDTKDNAGAADDVYVEEAVDDDFLVGEAADGDSLVEEAAADGDSLVEEAAADGDFLVEGDAAEPAAEPEADGDVPAEAAVDSVVSGMESKAESGLAAEKVLTGEGIRISGIEYVRVSSHAIAADVPCYLYMTRDEKAGNPIAAIYGGADEGSTETLLGIWADSFFSVKGVTNAYVYAVSEDALDSIRSDKSVYIRYPVYVLEAKNGELSMRKSEGIKTLPVSLLTSKAGLPEDRYVINGLGEPVYDPPKMERDERDLVQNDLQSSSFGRAGAVVIAVGIVIILAAVLSALVILRRKRLN